MMRIAIAGTRGIPSSYGGFETLAERLALALYARGYQVAVIGNTGNTSDTWQGIRRIRTRFDKQDHPVLFYLESLWRTRKGYDRVLVCGVGGAPFYRLFRMREGRRITHVDGLEHLRAKFSALRKRYVRMAQATLRKRSDVIVSDSAAVTRYWKEQLNFTGDIHTIAYGADPVITADKGLLPEGLLPGAYYLVVARPVPENNLGMIVRGWLSSQSAKALVIVGSDGSEPLYDFVDEAQRSRIVFAGAIYDTSVLSALRFHAFAYLHGHSVGGTNPALVEAMAAAAFCICHDNPFNRETTLNLAVFFTDPSSLADALRETERLAPARLQSARMSLLQLAQERYGWERIVDQYMEMFELAGR
jgi:glycosyltransferase involved in cell wall biosynthesis